MSKGKVEKVAEDQFVEEAFRRGILALKMEIPGWVNWPDRQVLLGHGYVYFIEFKRDGEEPRPGQVFRHKELRAKGYSVYVCYTLAEALESLETELGKMALII